MSTATALTPQILGQAENAHRALLDRVLAGSGLTFHQWVALKVTTAADPATGRDQLTVRLAGALKVGAAEVAAALAGLTAAGLLAEQSEPIALTGAGQARYRQISDAVAEIVGRLYRDLPAEDLATAGRVLSLITARADAELAA